MAEHHRGGSGFGQEVSDSRTLLERLRRSAESLESLATHAAPGTADAMREGLIQEAGALRQMQEQMRLLLKSLSFLTDSAHRLLNLPLDELESGLREALATLGRHTAVHRCYLFLLSEDGTRLTDVYEWCAPGVRPHDLKSFRGSSIESFTWSLRQFQEGQTVVVVDPSQLPREARPEQRVCRSLQVSSYVQAPLSLGGRLIGWLGFDAVGAPRQWSPEELGLMELTRSVLVSTLERKRRDEQLFREKELEQRARSLSILAAGLAHEINNPLSFTAGNLSYLKDVLPRGGGLLSEELAAESHEVLDEAMEGTCRIQRIVADLKSFSASDNGEVGPVDLEAVIDSTLRMASNQLRHRAQVVRDFANVPRVRGTTTRLGQVLLNLVLNAAQAIPEGHVSDHRVTVAVRTEGDMVVLSLSDTGCGIPPEVMPRIFDPFFTTRDVGEGMGMGLAICRNIVTGLGGKITVRSEPGQGTTVEVHLPRAEPVNAPDRSPEELALQPSGGRRVLAVDDEPRVLDLLRRLLPGHELVTAANGREALERLRSDARFDVILCDLMMPELTGMDVYRYVRDAHPGLHERIVFISGGAFTPETKRFLQQVRNTVVTKPFEPVHIRNVVTTTGVRLPN